MKPTLSEPHCLDLILSSFIFPIPYSLTAHFFGRYSSYTDPLYPWASSNIDSTPLPPSRFFLNRIVDCF